MAAILLLAGGSFFAFYLRKREAGKPEDDAGLVSVARLQLGPAQQVHLVACGESLLVLGATSSQISLLATLPRTEKHSQPRSYRHSAHVSRSESAPGAAPFDDLLRRLGSSATAGEAPPVQR